MRQQRARVVVLRRYGRLGYHPSDTLQENSFCMSDAPETDGDDPTYAYKPSLMGAPWLLCLKPEGLEYSVGRWSGLAPYASIRRVRLSFRPTTMQMRRFVAEIWAADAPKIQIVSTSWRSLVEQERLDAAYVSFVTELHRRLAEAGATATFVSGMPLLLYGVGVAVYVGALLAFAALTARALQIGEWTGAAMVGGFFALFAWQVSAYFWRNRPGLYSPDALPRNVLPRA
jgi:hypothetical protein